MPLAAQINLQAFDKWVVDFFGPISPLGKRTWMHHIINATDYLTRWYEVTPVKDCTIVTTNKFLFENVVTRFGCPKILLSDQGMHFVNKMIDELTIEFQIQHRDNTLSSLGEWNVWSVQKDPGECIKQNVQRASRWLGSESFRCAMGIPHNFQEINMTHSI